MNAREPGFVMVYDLREDPAALELVHRHRAYWGRSWTEMLVPGGPDAKAILEEGSAG
jgi:hypothetical protein